MLQSNVMKKATGHEKRSILVVGNWKLNPQTQKSATTLFSHIKKAVASKQAHARVALCPPVVFFGSVQKLSNTGRIALGAQDVFFESQGAFTGQISLSMLKDVGVQYVIVGHSEKRAQGESNETVAKKVATVLKGNITAIVCVGETTRDAHGDYFTVVETQLRAILKETTGAQVGRLVIAYEPVWAIGTGKNATADDIQEMKLFIQKVIADTLGRAAVLKIRILYGGSVTTDNAKEILHEAKVDGFLVGGASLKVVEFKGIVSIADAYGQ